MLVRSLEFDKLVVRANNVKRFSMGEELKEYKCDKVFDNEDEFYASDEMKEVWSGFQGQSMNERVGRKFKFICGFVMNVEKKKNYGQPFRLFKVYKSSEGLIFVGEETVHTIMSSKPLCLAYVGKDGFLISNLAVDKSPQGRKFLRTHSFASTSISR